MNTYPVLRSTLEGIFGSGVGLSDEEATSSLVRDLGHKPFRDALLTELEAALADMGISWKAFLGECDVAFFDTDDEARSFVVEHIQKPAKAHAGT